MKNKLITLMALFACQMAQAASPFVVSPDGYAPLTVGASENHRYIVGTDELTRTPMVWNTQNNEITLLIYQEEEDLFLGGLNAVTSQGIAVGKLTSDVSNQSRAIMTHVGSIDEFEFLYSEANEDGSEAMDISEDGSIIVGYYNTDNISSRACVWTNNGRTRTQLPTPTQEELGFTGENTKALWISTDGQYIGGSVTNLANGYPVFITWTKVGNNYTVGTPSRPYYGIQYAGFAPRAFSRNGEWAIVEVKALLAPGDWDSCDMPQAARLNLKSGAIEVYGDPCKWTPMMIAIANDGTAVGYTQAGMDPEDEQGLPVGLVWAVGAKTMIDINDMYAGDEYLATRTASKACAISPDAQYLIGYAGDAEGDQSAYCVRMGSTNPDWTGEFIISPTMAQGYLGEVAFKGESVSNHRKYVGGTDEYSLYPVVWDVENNNLQLLIVEGDSAYHETTFDEFGELIEEGYWEYGNFRGDIHAINDEGIAIGTLESNFSDHSKAFLYDAKTREITYLAEDPLFDSHNAWAMTSDAEIILGHTMGINYDDPLNPYQVQSCIWTNHGQTLTYLPVPTRTTCGFPVDYAEARWMSEDGQVIYGFVQDGYTGSWVAIHWLRNEMGEYVPQSLLPSYYTYQQTQLGNKFYMVQPSGLSANGEWATLIMQREYDEWDWDVEVPAQQAARINLVSGDLQLLDLGEGITNAPELFGIANNGTAVGRFLIDQFTTAAVVWYTGEEKVMPLSAMFSDDDYVQMWLESSLTYISADGKYVMGDAFDADEYTTSFMVGIPLQQPTAICQIVSDDKPTATKAIVNGQIIIKDGAKYTITGVRL